MNIFVAEDINWDNYAIVSKHISTNYLPSDTKINHTYGKHLEKMSNICNNNMLQIMRRILNPGETETTVYNILKTMDLCIIFHNFVEYNTISSFVIEACIKNDIDYIIISEHSDKYYLNGELCTIKFKNTIKTLTLKDRGAYSRKLIETGNIITIFENVVQPKSIEETIIQIRNSYSRIAEQRKNSSIVTVEKTGGKYSENKQIAYIDYMRHKKKWLKDVIPRS
jgi:hypothetical protein